MGREAAAETMRKHGIWMSKPRGQRPSQSSQRDFLTLVLARVVLAVPSFPEGSSCEALRFCFLVSSGRRRRENAMSAHFTRRTGLFWVLLVTLLLTLCTERGALADESTNRIVMSDGKTGFIGVGTASPQAAFDAYGNEIKVGSSGAACSARLADALRSSGNKLQFCDGAGWRNVSLDKAE
jgi:hypothetical protein